MVFWGLQLGMAVTCTVAVARGRRGAIWFAGFAAVMTGLDVTVAGVALSWPLIGTVVLGIAAAFTASTRGPRPWLLPIIGLVYWGTSLALYYWLLDSQTHRLIEAAIDRGWGPGQTVYRYPVQLLAFLIMLAGFAFAARAVRGREEVWVLASGFLTGLAVSSGYGVVMALLHGQGSDLLAFNELTSISARAIPTSIPTFNLAGLPVARIYGLSGEPKHLAGMCVLGLAVIYAMVVAGRAPRRHVMLYGLLIVAIGLSFSTSGYVAAAAAVTIAGIHAFVTRRIDRRLIIVPGVALLLGVLALGQEAQDQLISERILGRLASLETVGAFEYKDAALLDWAAANPGSTVTGVGPGGIDFYIEEYTPNRMITTTTVTPTYTATRMLGDTGMVGLVLLLWLIGSTTKRLRSWRPGWIFATVAATVLIQPATILPAYLILLGGVAQGHGAIVDRVPPSATVTR